MNPTMTSRDLDICLKSLENRIAHYRVENSVRPNPYNINQIKKLERMVIETLARFYERYTNVTSSKHQH